MSASACSDSVWNRLDSLTPDDLLRLGEAAAAVLQTGWEGEEQVATVPAAPLAGMLREALVQAGAPVDDQHVRMLTTDRETAVALCRALLAEIARVPSLAAEVESTYQARRKMMAVDPVSLLMAGAVLVLALKVKMVDLRQGKLEFHKLSNAAVSAVCKLLGIRAGE